MNKMPSYETYVRAYREKQNQLARRGYRMYDELMSASEYATQYTALRNDQLKDVAAGRRKRAGNVLRDLVNDQAYQFTKKQAMKQLEVAKQFGHKTNIQRLMSGTDTEFTRILQEQRQLLKEEGYSNQEINLIMSQEYFGSP